MRFSSSICVFNAWNSFASSSVSNLASTSCKYCAWNTFWSVPLSTVTVLAPAFSPIHFWSSCWCSSSDPSGKKYLMSEYLGCRTFPPRILKQLNYLGSLMIKLSTMLGYVWTFHCPCHSENQTKLTPKHNCDFTPIFFSWCSCIVAFDMNTIRFVTEPRVTESICCPCLTQNRNNDSFGPDRRRTMPLTP